MQTITERFLEYTEVQFARIRVTIEHPRHGRSFTTAMHIPEHMVDDFEKEAAARDYIKKLFSTKSKNFEFDLRQAQMNLHEAEDKARETRQQLSHLVTRSLSDAYGQEVTK